MAKYIYILSLTPSFKDPANWTDRERNIVSEHFNHLVKLKEDGVLVIAGKTKYEVDNDENFGIAVFKAESKEDAERIMNSDPAIVNGLMTAVLHPFNVAVGDQ